MSNYAKYVSNGTYRQKLEAFFGPLEPIEDAEIADWMEKYLTLLAPELAVEVEALYTLHEEFDVPELCDWGVLHVCTWPALYSLDEEEFRDEEYFDEEADEERALSNVVLFNNSWGTYVTIGEEGVLHLYEDPHFFEPLCDDFGAFLDAILHLEAAKQGKFPASEAIKKIENALQPSEGGEFPLFIQNTLDIVRSMT